MQSIRWYLIDSYRGRWLTSKWWWCSCRKSSLIWWRESPL